MVTSLRRYALPGICAAFAGSAALWGETVLREHAGRPTLGPLLADQVALMLAVAFTLLGGVSLLIAMFPGEQASPAEAGADDADASIPAADAAVDAATVSDAVSAADADGTGSDQPAEALPETGATEADHTGGDRAPERSPRDDTSRGDEGGAESAESRDVVLALKRALSEQSRQRVAAEEAVRGATVRADQAEAALAAFRDGTAPEVQALVARLREEVSRDAMRKVHELGESAERLVRGLKEAKDRAEADLAEVVRSSEERVARLESEATEQIDALGARLREAEAAIPAVRHQSAVEAHRRIQIALEAINDAQVDVLDHLQREAVSRYAARVSAALSGLDPEAQVSFVPAVDLPPLEASASGQSDDTPAASERAGSASKTVRSRARGVWRRG